jgi:hypothetical protein
MLLSQVAFAKGCEVLVRLQLPWVVTRYRSKWFSSEMQEVRVEGKGFTDRGDSIRQSCAAESVATAGQGLRVETMMMPSVVGDATYGCPALSPCSDFCKWSVSILMSQVACAEGK